MRPRTWILVAVPAALCMLWACVGDDPVIVQPASDAAAPGDGGNAADGGDAGDGSATGDASPASLCSNGQKDVGETDIDCGGSACAKCVPDKACLVDGDCITGKCSTGYCEFAKLAWLPGPPLTLSDPAFDAGSKENAYGRELFSALASDGTIRAVAGYAQIAVDGSKGTSASEHYIDLGANDTSWSVAVNTIGPRRLSAAAVGADSKMYIFGGQSDTGGTPYLAAATWTRDPHPATGSWAQAGHDLAVPRTDFAAALGPDGYIYAFGGVADLTNGTLTDVIEAFGPSASPVWGAIGAKMTAKRIGLAAVTGQDGQIYLLGGGLPGSATRVVEAFDVKKKSFTTRADMLDPHTHFAAASGPDGRIYAIAGDIGSDGQASTHVEAYSPITNTWTRVTDLPTARVGHGAVVAPDGRIWAISGAKSFPGYELVAQVEIYGPTIALGAATVSAGGTIAVSGANFAPNAAVHIYVDDRSGAPLASGTASALGALTSVTVKVPATVAPGNHRIVVVDDLSRYPVSTPVSVL